MKKYLEATISLESDTYPNGVRENIEIEYYLTESTAEIDDSDERRVYGVEIVKKGSKCIENNVIKNFSCNKDYTRDVIKKLIRNTVTPITLNSVLYDLIVE